MRDYKKFDKMILTSNMQIYGGHGRFANIIVCNASVSTSIARAFSMES